MKAKILFLIIFTLVGHFSFGQCSITFQKITVSRCYIASGEAKATLSIEVAWQNAPLNDSIAVVAGGQTRYVYTGMRTLVYDDTTGVTNLVSPQIIAFTLDANGSTGNPITAAFTTNAGCNTSGTFNLPVSCFPMSCSPTNDVGGQVFFDYDANGVKNSSEAFSGQSNVAISVIDVDGTVYNTTSGRFGFWSVNVPLNKYPVRVEFTLGVILRMGTPNGSDGNTTTQFVNAPSCNIDLGVLNNEDYCDANPTVYVPCYINGDPLASGSAVANLDAIVGFPYTASGDNPALIQHLATGAQVGSTWGIAYNNLKKQLIASATLKRHVGLGPEGLGGIYFIDPSITSGSKVVASLDVAADLGINVGSIPSNSARGLATTTGGPSADAAAYLAIGNVGIGDIDISDNGRFLFFVNLFDKKLYRVDLNGYNTSNTLPTAANVTSYDIPDPNCTGGEFKPWALKWKKGLVYVGGVCNAITSQDKKDLRAYVYTFNNNTTTFVAAPAFDFPLTYPKGYPQRNYPNETGWHPWTYDWNTKVNGVAGNGRDSILIHPEPILLDIDLDVDESIVLAFGDLTGFQGGFRNLAPDGTGTSNASGTGNFNTINGGDILRGLRSTGTSFVLENNGIVGESIGAGVGNSQGPGFGEFYNDNFYFDFGTSSPFGIKLQHAENGVGGLAIRNGSGQVIHSVMDPIDNNANAGGVRFLSNTTGLSENAFQLYNTTGTNTEAGTFAKATGLGDAELACARPTYIEIGNYVWYDRDLDGVQDPDETPLNGVRVSLYKGGVKIAETLTNSIGQYYFSSTSASDPNLNWIGTGADTIVLPSTAYNIVFGETQFSSGMLTLSGTDYFLTVANSTIGTGNDINDSDATIISSFPTIQITSPIEGAVNHTYDVGFYTCPEAGTGSPTTVCDNSTTVIDLFSLLTGEDTGGTWTRTTGTGGAFVAATGMFTPAPGATTSTFTYTVGGGGCPTDTEVVTVNINAAANAGTGSSIIECAGSGTVVNLFNLLTGEQSGGTWTRVSGTGGTFTAASGSYTITSTATNSVFRYTVTGTSPCPNDTEDVTVTVTSAPTAGTGSATPVCDNSTTAIDLFSLLTGEDAGGTWTRTTGTGGTFVAATGLFTPSPGATTSTFTYTVGGGGCPTDTEVVTVNINAAANAGTGSSIIECAGSGTVVNLFNLLTGEQSGGTWTRVSGTGGTFTAASGSYTITSTATNSVFRYTVTGTSPCPNDTEDVTVTVTSAPTAGTGSATPVCDNSTTAIDLFSLLTGEDAGGTWTRTTGTGGTFVAATGMFTPAPGATTSTFTYTVGGGGCPTDTEVVTVNINAAANAGTGSSVIECAGSGTVVNLFDLLTGEQSGGTWTRVSGTGGTFTAASGSYTITSTATNSVFRYTVTGTSPCPNDTEDVTVTVTSAPTAGTGSATPVCDNSTTAIDLFSLLTGEDAGGTWTRTTGTGGTFVAATGLFTPSPGATTSTFTYTVGGGGCPTDTEVVTVNINAAANAGTGSSVIECAGNNVIVNLFDLLTGEQSGGTWTRVSGTGGTFTAASGSYTITSAATTSVFRYTVTGTAPCPNDTEDVTVTVNPAPTAGTGSATTVCDNGTTAIDLFSLLTGEDAGGTWTRTTGTGGTFVAATGMFTPVPGATTSTFTYQVGGGGCPTDTEVVTVNINAAVNAGTGSSVTECAGNNVIVNLFDLLAGEQSGGTWTRVSGTGGTFTAASGTYTITSTATNSVFRYTVTGTSPCPNDTEDVTVTVTAAPTAGTGSSTTVCDNSTTAIDLYSLLTGEDAGGTWTRTTGTGGTFVAATGMFTPTPGATTSTFTYTVGGGGCPTDTEVVTVNINAAVNAGTGSSVTECAGNNVIVNLFDLLAGEQSGGTWTRVSGTGGTFTAASGTYTITSTATTSVFRYTVTGTAPCPNDTEDVTVTVNPAPTAGTGSATTVCDNSTTAIDLYSLLTGEDAGGTWTRTTGTGGTFVAATGMFTPAPGATTSTFTYQVGGGGCPTDTEVVTVNIVRAPNAGNDGIAEGCEGGTVVINLFNNISNEDLGGVWTRVSGSGGVFDAVGGTYALTAGATSSIFQYTVAGIMPCSDDASVVNVTVIGSCCAINPISLISNECDDNGTLSKITDNRILARILVTNQNSLLTNYTVSVNGGTSITPSTGIYGIPQLFRLGPGTAGGGATFRITITDQVTGTTCQGFIDVIGNVQCAGGLPNDCPTPKCGTATIQVNGN
jgi:hypothetical protein